MYSNNSKSIKDALCFLMDEEQGHEIAYVQFPQAFENVTKNDLYGNDFRVGREVSEYHWNLILIFLVLLLPSFSFFRQLYT